MIFIIVKEIKCKSLLNKSKLEADYCINPYVGCQHACHYCYSDFYVKKYTTHREEWGEFVDVKINAPEVLRRDVLRKKKGSVFVSSLTDPYQPLEKRYELTRKCLEILLRNNFSVWIQTKSSLILRDINLFKRFKNNCEVGFTITTLDDNIREKFEPFSFPVNEKLEALKILKENEIKTFVFFGPVLPYLSDRNLDEYFKTVAELKVDEVWIDKLNLKPGVWEAVSSVLENNYPELLPKWKEIFFSKGNYYQKLKKEIIELCKENKLNYIFCY